MVDDAEGRTPDVPAEGAATAPPAAIASRRPSMSQVRRLVAVGAAAAVAGLLICVVTTLLAAPGLSGAAAEDASTDWTGTEGVALPVLVWAAAWGGSLRLEGDVGVEGSLTYVPLGVTVLVMVALGALSWWDERQQRPSDAESLWTRIVVTALGNMAVVAVIAALVPVGAGPLTVHGFGLRLVLVGSLLSIAASAAGRSWALRAVPRPSLLAAPAARPVVAALDVVGVHAVVLLVLLCPLTLVAALVAIDEPGALLTTVPLWLVNAAAGLAVVGHGGGLTVGAVGGSVLGTEAQSATLSLFSGDGTGWLWLAVPFVLVAAAVASCRVVLRWRDQDATALPRWVLPIALPLTWLLASWLVLNTTADVSGSLLGFGVGGGVGMSMAAWTLVVLAAWGGLIELFTAVVPALAARLPSAAVVLLRRPWGAAPTTVDWAPPPTAPAADQPIPDTSAEPAVAGAGDDAAGASAGAPRPPLSVRTKASLALAGVAVLACVAAAVLVSVLNGSVFAPERRVEDFLAAVSAGHAAEALSVADVDVSNADRVLLSDAVLGQATDRPSSVEIVNVEKEGDQATVTARYDVAGDKVTQDYSLHRDGRQWLLFASWAMDPPELPLLSVQSSFSPVLVNDATVDLAQGGRELPAFPGTYSVRIDDRYVTAEPVPATVTATSEWSSAVSVEVQPQPTDLFRSEVQGQVDAWVDECAASREAGPEGCPFQRWWTYTKARWKVDRRAEFSLEPSYWDSSAWDVQTTTPGQVTFVGTPTFSDEEERETIDFDVDGSVTFEQGSPRFSPS